MPRASYFRKRPGYRAYVHLLWRGLWPLLEAAAPEAERRRASALVAPELPQQHRQRFLALLAEYGDALKADLGFARLPPTLPPEIVARGAEIPAPMLVRSSALFRFAIRPRGRTKAQARSKPPKPDQRDVTAWMLAHAEAGAVHGTTIKLREAEADCMRMMGASRSQARIAMRQVPSILRRRRGDRDRAK